jgi:hypothetical protein
MAVPAVGTPSLLDVSQLSDPKYLLLPQLQAGADRNACARLPIQSILTTLRPMTAGHGPGSVFGRLIAPVA